MPVEIRISPDLHIAAGKLSGLGTAVLSRIMDEVAPQVAPKIEDAIKAEAPVRTGRGRDSIRATATQNPRSARITITGNGYLRFVDKGAAPHEILPRNARMLAWVTDAGTLVFSKGVHHPGQTANPFVERAWGVVQPEISAEIRAVGLRAWRDLAHFR